MVSSFYSFTEAVYSLSFVSGALRAAKIGLEDAIVLKVNAKAGNVPALQLDVNVIQMFAGIVGLGIEFLQLFISNCSLGD